MSIRQQSILAFLLLLLLLELFIVSRAWVSADTEHDTPRDRSDVRVNVPAPVGPPQEGGVAHVSISPPPTPTPPSVPSGSSLVTPPAEPPSVGTGSVIHISTAAGSSSMLDLTAVSVSHIGGYIGLFIKCEVLANAGWPLPRYLSECVSTSTPPNPPPPPPPGTASLIILKHSGDFDDTFGFTLTGRAAGTTSITTSGGEGGVQLIVDPGTTTVAEDTPPSGWSLVGIGCSQNATSSGFAVGSSSWSIFLPAGAQATCNFTNFFKGGEGGGGDVPGDGGGDDGEDGGDDSNGGGPPGGGVPPTGGGGPPTSGGGNGPVVGSLALAAAPSVLGAATTSSPTGVGGYVPEMPNTGAGGNASMLLLTLLASFSGALASFRGFFHNIRRTAYAKTP